MDENYNILGLKRGATREQVEAAYSKIRAKLREDRFLDGEAGNEAARKLTMLEQAYSEIMFELGRTEAKTTYGNDLGEIDQLIRQGNYDQAQNMLDNVVDRSAEWHYLQSIIFYKRNWFLESRKQLQNAINLDPGNQKYRTAMHRLESVMAAPTGPNTRNMPPPPPVDDYGGRPRSEGSDCMNCCAGMCLADMCCRMGLCCR